MNACFIFFISNITHVNYSYTDNFPLFRVYRTPNRRWYSCQSEQRTAKHSKMDVQSEVRTPNSEHLLNKSPFRISRNQLRLDCRNICCGKIFTGCFNRWNGFIHLNSNNTWLINLTVLSHNQNLWSLQALAGWQEKWRRLKMGGEQNIRSTNNNRLYMHN